MFRIALILCAAVMATGCASTVGAFFNRPVVEDSVSGAISTVSLAADRRTVVKDKLETTVTVIAERTAPLDAFRTGVYALCQYHLNGALAKEDVRPLFEKLIDAFAASESGRPKKPVQ